MTHDLTGSYRNTLDFDCYRALDRCVYWGTHVLDDIDGGWDCSWTGMEDPTDTDWVLVLGVCPGTGGHEGLTYTFDHIAGDGGEGDFGGGSGFRELICEGPPPAWGPIPMSE